MQQRRALAIIFVLIGIVAAGVVGYMVIEGWSFLDALYMTIITISTVGYQEVAPLSQASKIFSVVLIVVGVGAMLYTLTTVVQYLLEGHLVNIWGRRRMKDRIGKLNDHVILCGHGVVGREVAQAFVAEGVEFVVIERDAASMSDPAEKQYSYVEGDATHDDVLEAAGITRARALVAALGTDADNVYVTLSARGMRSGLFIVARASTAESEPKLIRAGADRTMSPYRVGGRRLAMLTLRPVVVDFIDTTMRSRGGDLVLENVRISAGSPVTGLTLGEGRQICGDASILAVQKKDGDLLANPAADVVLDIDDEIIVAGTREQLRHLEGSV